MIRPKVAFVCVHNSCRSQIAEALGKLLASDAFDSCSAGTEKKPRINQDAVRLMKAVYGIDIERDQFCKLIEEIPPVDIVITMGCDVSCSSIPCTYREDWGIEDPTEKDDDAFLEVIRTIEAKIVELGKRLSSQGIDGMASHAEHAFGECGPESTAALCRIGGRNTPSSEKSME